MPSKHRDDGPEGPGTVARPFLTLSPPGRRARKESCVTFAKKGNENRSPRATLPVHGGAGNMLRANSEDAQAISSSLQVLAGIQGPRGPQTQTRRRAVSSRHPALTEGVRMMESKGGRVPTRCERERGESAGQQANEIQQSTPDPALGFPAGFTRPIVFRTKPAFEPCAVNP